ncbi:MAG: NAD(P)-binding protein [Bacteroidota bacterium]|nr:NAD(P)-binding protein [Bacteroidota bacterium]
MDRSIANTTGAHATRSSADITSLPDLLGHAHGTGASRSRRPVYRNQLPPCNHACPAGQNIQAWLSLAREGNAEEAWQVIMQENPLPAVLGRICYHPCEDGCNRAATDSAVNIHALERWLGDQALEKGWTPQIAEADTGKRVLVVGAGPGGLSAAYHLRRMGHTVEIHEAGPVAGGMMHFGIPAYRLPRNILEKEIERITRMGVRIVLNHPVRDIRAEREAGSFDAVFIAIGAHLAKKVDIPSREAGRMMDALTLLKQVENGVAPTLGRKVAIYGGGNTAMDAARTVQRLTGHEAMIIYRRDREHIPAHDFEVKEALEEGIKINWLRTIKAMGPEGLRVEVMKLEDGRPVPTGQYETLEADTLILAVGQDTDTAWLKNVEGLSFRDDGTIEVGPDMMTGCAGIFCGGDMVPSERTAAIAIGHGKKAARHIDGWLKGKPYSKAPTPPVIGPEGLHLWMRTDAPQQEQYELSPAQRVQGFDEVKAGLSDKEALFEAERCLSCGNCYECDGCFGSCPEQAIVRLGEGNGYRVETNLCTGCGVCAEQCPCQAIAMVAEPLPTR